MPPAPARRTITLIALIAAGEAAFMLPFLPARVFRPTVLDVFGLTNLQLGTAYSVYGIVAMGAYLIGGPLADRFPPRLLLMIALLTTAAGGLAVVGLAVVLRQLSGRVSPDAADRLAAATYQGRARGP